MVFPVEKDNAVIYNSAIPPVKKKKESLETGETTNGCEISNITFRKRKDELPFSTVSNATVPASFKGWRPP